MKHLNITRELSSASILFVAALLAMTPVGVRASFTIGNLAVEQLQSNLTSSAFSIIELSPYHTNSSPVTSNSIPSTGAGALRQTSAGTAGRVALTQDRTLIAFTGAIDGTGVADETAITNRGVGTFDANGKYTLQANYTNSTGSGDQARSATSLDNNTWYFGDKLGIYTNGINTPLNTTNVGAFRCFGGAVYAASTKAKAVVSTVSASGRNLTGLPGLPADANVTDFYMIASGNDGITNDILYVSDGATIGKYSLVSGTWVANTPNAPIAFTADGLCAMNNGQGAFLYITTGAGPANSGGGAVIKMIDSAGYNAPPTINPAYYVTLYTNAPYLKGIDFAPLPKLAAEQLQQNTASSQFSIVELNPYQTNSSPVNSITIPITGASALRQSSAGSTGRLALTGDRTLLAFSGANDGTGVPDETTVLLRGAGTIDSSASGNYTLQTTYTGVSGNQARSATSLDKTNWYFGDKGGIYTNNTTTPLNTTNVRVLKVFGGQLIACAASSKSASPSVLSAVSADATTLTPLPGLESTIDANALDFYMIASGVNGSTNDIAYVNDYGGNPLEISKYSLVSGSWTLSGTATLGVTADGICAINTGGGANLYVTTGAGPAPGGEVVEITDTAGWNAAPAINTANNVVLYVGAPYLKGIDFAPVGSSSSGGNNLNIPPTITPDPSATVDGLFTNTFTDDPVWRTSITNITVNSVTLSPSAYNTNHPGEIIFTPAASVLLQSSGSKSLVFFATNYNSEAVPQIIGPGAPKQLAITTQPTAPSGNGGTLVTQPVLTITDQYGNPATNAATFAASVGTGTWSFGAGSGTNVVAFGGTATFTNLSATGANAVSGATITFTVSGSGAGGLPFTTTNSSSFNIPTPSTAFTPGNLAVEQEDLVAKNSTFSILELNPTTANQSSPINTFAISATGPNALRQSSAATTGRLADSEDGTLVCFAAAETQDGSLVTTADVTAVTNRGVGTLNANGASVLQASYQGIGGATANQARSATTLDNTNWFIGDKGGVYTNGLVNPWIGGTGSNVRSLKSFGGTVYALQQSSTTLNASVLQIVPQGNGTIYVNGYPSINPFFTLYPVDGFPEDPVVLDFYMIQSGNHGSSYDVVYYIDGTNNTTGAIFKYFLNGTDDNGLPAYAFAGSANTPDGGDGLCAATNTSGGVDLYYTTGSGGIAGNSLVKVTDSAAWDAAPVLGAFQTNYTASSLATLKGVAFAPVPPANAPAVTMPLVITPGSTLITGSGASATLQFSFINTPGLIFSILATNNVAAPISTWPVIQTITDTPPGSGQYHFTDQNSATNSHQFYILRQP